MKSITLGLILFLTCFSISFGQQEKGITGNTNWLNNWTEFRPNKSEYGEPTQILTGNITENTTLFKKDVYLLLGNVFVINNAKLKIEPGTVILGDYKTNGSLTISKGAKIIAEGQKTDPIIFSSNRSIKRSGDWGGLIILGDAPINRNGTGSVSNYFPNLKPANYGYTSYGGEKASGYSGTLRFLRIEYAGKRVSQATHFNGLLLASVGESTILDHIMVSNCEDDGFEIWGGTVALSNIVSYKSKGTDFKFNFGTAAVLTNSLAVRSPYVSNGNSDKCLEVKSYNKKEEFNFSKKQTSVQATNITFLNDSNNLKSAIKMNLVHEAIYVAENAELNMTKSVISGFNPAVVFSNKVSLNQQNLEKISFKDMYFNNCNGNIFIENNTNNDDLENWYGNSAFFNVYSKGDNIETFIAAYNYKKPDYRLRINKIIATNINSSVLDD